MSNATQAIEVECRFCASFNACSSAFCKLRDSSVSALERIKAHCLSCVPEQSVNGVRECTGKLTEGKTCPLHPYREGKSRHVKCLRQTNIRKEGINT